MFLETTKKRLVFFFGVAMPRATTGLLERLLDPKLRKIRSTFAVGGFCLRFAARWSVALLAGWTCFRLSVVFWTTDTEAVFQIQRGPTVEVEVLVPEDFRPAADSEPGHAFEKIGSLLFGPFVLGLLAWLPLASGLLGSRRLVTRQASAPQVASLGHRTRIPRFGDLDIGLSIWLPRLFDADRGQESRVRWRMVQTAQSRWQPSPALLVASTGSGRKSRQGRKIPRLTVTMAAKGALILVSKPFGCSLASRVVPGNSIQQQTTQVMRVSVVQLRRAVQRMLGRCREWFDRIRPVDEVQ
jgi:hypothetical protein